MVVVERVGIGVYESVISTLTVGRSSFFPRSAFLKDYMANVTMNTKRHTPEALEKLFKDPE